MKDKKSIFIYSILKTKLNFGMAGLIEVFQS